MSYSSITYKICEERNVQPYPTFKDQAPIKEKLSGYNWEHDPDAPWRVVLIFDVITKDLPIDEDLPCDEYEVEFLILQKMNVNAELLDRFNN